MQLEVLLDRPGRNPLRLTPLQDTLRWSSAAVGGFGNCSFTLPGDPRHWKREVPLLARVALVLDTQLLWEGQVEDATHRFTGEPGTDISCFGYQRLLHEVSVRRVWSQRSLDWYEVPGQNKWGAAFGAIDDTDLSRVGVRMAGLGDPVTAANDKAVRAKAPAGLTWTRLLGLYRQAGSVANFDGTIHSSSDGASFTLHVTLTTTATDFDLALVANARIVQLGLQNGASWTPANDDAVSYENMRLLGTTVVEDDNPGGASGGGFYGGTILRDLIALVPGLTPGIIEDGDDFTLEAIERAVRSAAIDVVDEVAAFYTRYWGVWEDSTFEWREHHLDEPHWLITLADLADGSEITESVDGLARTFYVQYADAADGRDKEASASSTAQRNPYVKHGRTKDELVPTGFDMTANSSAQLAAKLATDAGSQYPHVEGSLVLPWLTMIRRAKGGKVPAYMIRGGETFAVTDLPKTDLLAQGRDGETLFHIVSAEADGDSGLVSLDIEGQTRRADVLLARLAAVTR